MAQLIIPGAVQVSLHFTVSGQETVNVLGFTGEILPPDTVVNRVWDAWVALGGPMKMLPDAVKLTRIKGTSLSSPDGAVFERSGSVIGGTASNPGNLATAAVVRIGAGTRSRSGKGRVFFGPLTQSQLSADGRTLATGVATGIQNAFNQFRTQVNVDTMRWAVLSRKLSTATPVDSVSVASIVGTQRRRLR